MKSVFEKFQNRFGEGTAFDLDYGKLIILLLLVYLAFLSWTGDPGHCTARKNSVQSSAGSREKLNYSCSPFQELNHQQNTQVKWAAG